MSKLKNSSLLEVFPSIFTVKRTGFYLMLLVVTEESMDAGDRSSGCNSNFEIP